MRIARGDSVMSFQTIRYKRVFSLGERFSTARTLRLIHGLRRADLPTATTTGFNRRLTPENTLPSANIALTRRNKGNFAAGAMACSSEVFKCDTPFFLRSGACLGSNYNNRRNSQLIALKYTT